MCLIKEFNDIKIGDSVHFTFIWDEDGPYAKNFKIVGRGIFLIMIGF